MLEIVLKKKWNKTKYCIQPERCHDHAVVVAGMSNFSTRAVRSWEWKLPKKAFFPETDFFFL